MNKSDLEKMQKCKEEYKKFFEDTPFQREIDKIARDIRNRQDNAMAMEFTRTIAELLRENGIVVHCTETSYTKDLSDKSIEKVYGVVFDSIDCAEHDKKYKDEIAQLKHDLEETKKKAGELEEIYKRERAVIDNLYCRCSKRAETPFRDRRYACLRITTIDELNDKISDLESELSVKENLLKINNGLCGEKLDYEKLAEEILNYELENKEDDIAQFNYESIRKLVGNRKIENRIAELEDRHQSDCITINQLHTALDIMTEKYQRLRDIHGL